MMNYAESVNGIRAVIGRDKHLLGDLLALLAAFGATGAVWSLL